MSETVKQEGDFKIKKSKRRMKNLNKTDEVIKVDLSKPQDEVKKEEEVTKVVIPSEPKVENNADTEQETTEVVADKPTEVVQEVGEQVSPGESTVQAEDSKEESSVLLQEITEEEVEEVKQEVKEAKKQAEETGKPLPENIEKLVSFMEETGGTIEDYVRLNADYSNVDDNTLLREYYKQTKPHLDSEEVDFLMEDSFSFDEELEEEREIRKKKLAMKEEIAKAKNFLESTKSKYYDDIKLRPGVTQEQQKAMEFFDRYTKEQETASKQHNDFVEQTKDYFNSDFKGFDFNVGQKKFRYGVQDPNKLADKQSNITNLVGKFFDNQGKIKDSKGYHKAIYAAENVDTIANHFYEQGKADAVREVVDGSKNPSAEPRATAQTNGFVNGIKAKVIGGNSNDSSKLTIKKIKI
jgi:hypothetical protein|tara:strand:- start:391 stop:1617 length:1227 start_codon:yes stop_codon:yes gene_type:complete